MELMLEYKEGKHVNQDPDAVINEYYATFPDPPASSPEIEPRSPPAQDGGGNADTPAAQSAFQLELALNFVLLLLAFPGFLSPDTVTDIFILVFICICNFITVMNLRITSYLTRF